jgi:ureidoacrylate peracid hydrolase
MLKQLTDPRKTALIVIDIQNDYCGPDGKIAKERGLDVSELQYMIPNLIKFVEQTRDMKLPIIFTQMIEDPEYMAENAKLKKAGHSLCTPDTEGFEYYKIKPEETDYQLIKKSYDSFSNPELERILKKHKIKNLIIVGAYTAVCVDATIRTGFTKGYNIIVPEDLVGMPGERKYQHEAALDVWRLIFAHVVKSEEIIKLWQESKHPKKFI